jgi:hypothetical protein
MITQPRLDLAQPRGSASCKCGNTVLPSLKYVYDRFESCGIDLHPLRLEPILVLHDYRTALLSVAYASACKPHRVVLYHRPVMG